MPVRIRISTVGERRVGRALSVVAERASDLRPAFLAIAEDIRIKIADEILTEGHGKWEPLNPDYEEWKDLKWGPQPMLVASGQLLDSFMEPDAVGSVTVIDHNRMRIGSTIPYLRFHQSIGPRTIIPRRAPLNFDENDRRRWRAIIEDFTTEGIGEFVEPD